MKDRNQIETLKEFNLIQEIKIRLEKSKIPSQKEREDILNLVEELQISASEEERQNKIRGIIEEFIKLKEEKYFDQRSVFKDKSVLNKSFIKEITKNQISDGNTNMVRISIDVEGLKTINDIMGHETGDRYLRRVYEQLEKSINDVKEIYKDQLGELEFYISAEGGDEFGVLIIGKKEGVINLSEGKFKSSEKDEGKKTLGMIINEKMNDNLGEIDTKKEGILDKERVVNKFKEVYQKRFEKILNNLKEDLNNKEYLDRKCRQNEQALLSTSGKNSLDEISNEEKKAMIIKIAENENERKFTEIDERFKEYEFFASASSGEVVLSELLQNKKNQEIVANKSREISKKSNLFGEKSENIAKMDLFFYQADKRMNKQKAMFKAQARESIELGDNDPESNLHDLYLRGRNLMTHMMVLSRNDEQTELLLELADVSDENKELDKKLKSLKVERDALFKALNDCRAQLKSK